MGCKKYIQMIDEYLQEPNNINREWVECLTVCRSCLERMRPKKPIIEMTFFGGTKIYHCPKCSNRYGNTKYNFCPNCGQSLDWSDVE